MAGTYFSALDKMIYEAHARLTAEQEAKIIEIYIKHGRSLISKIAGGRLGDPLNRAYREYASQLFRDINQTVRDYGYEASLTSQERQTLAMLELIGDRQTFAEDYSQVASKVTKPLSRSIAENVFKGGLYADGKGLSHRIWNITQQSARDIQNIVAEGVSRGMSAGQLARALETYVKPSARKAVSEALGIKLGPGYRDLEYNALRMARTTISHIATASMKEWGTLNPFAEKVQWHSAHAPGRTCDICLDLDGQIFTLADCPYDHPNGLCWTEVYYDKSMDEMAEELKAWVDGEENEGLENWYRKLKSFDD